MGDLLEQLKSLSGESVGLVIAALAVALIMFGSVVLILTFFGRWARTLEQDGSSRLLPTLVEDVLDLDLQRVYRRALILDHQVANTFDALAEPTGTELGRHARKWVVRLQAERFAARRDPTFKNQRGEPPVGEARLKEVSAVIEEALDRLPIDDSGAGATAEAARLLDELSAQIEPVSSSNG